MGAAIHHRVCRGPPRHPEDPKREWAQDATELVANLRSYHNTAQKLEEKVQFKYSGLALYEGKIKNNLEFGVVEPAISKIKSLRFATEAAITILRIDDMIKLAPAQPPQGAGGMPGGGMMPPGGM